jgi:hypothetical protein
MFINFNSRFLHHDFQTRITSFDDAGDVAEHDNLGQRDRRMSFDGLQSRFDGDHRRRCRDGRSTRSRLKIFNESTNSYKWCFQ